jgi:hypothetical protein
MNTIHPIHPIRLGLGLLCLMLLGSEAQAQPVSFNTTNVLCGPGFGNGSQVIAGFPTNTLSASTGFGQGTGGTISVANNDFVLLCVRAYICTNVGGGTPTTNNLQLTLIRSASGNPPGVQTGTNCFTANGTNVQSSDWESWSNVVPYFAAITVPLNVSTGYVCWQTNLTREFIGGANWLGIGNITLEATNAFLTNLNIGVAKKILPIRYP